MATVWLQSRGLSLTSTLIISAWWLRISSKLSGKKSKKQPENLEMDNS